MMSTGPLVVLHLQQLCRTENVCDLYTHLVELQAIPILLLTWLVVSGLIYVPGRLKTPLGAGLIQSSEAHTLVRPTRVTLLSKSPSPE